jgi:putative zinc finger protein
MTAGPDPFEHDDAAYVLGALSHEDRMAYEAHLQHCPRCSAAVAELAVLPGLLARTPGALAGSPALRQPTDTPPTDTPPPDTVLPRLLAAVRRSRRRRRITAAAASVAAALALVGGTAVVTRAVTDPEPPAATQPAGVPVTLEGDVPVSAELRLEDVAWGTRITILCRYEGPVSSGPPDPALSTYQLVLVAAGDAAVQNVATWNALPGKVATVGGSTDLHSDEIASVELRNGYGTVLMAGSVPR